MDLRALLVDLQPFLTAIGSLAIIVAVIQLRINARQAASRTAFDLIGKITDPTFPVRRHLMYEVAAKYAAGDWTGYDRSLDDFQVRNFANIYEQLGLLVRRGLINLPDVMEALSAQIMADWQTFQPIRNHIIEASAAAYPDLAADQTATDSLFWPNFNWLAEQNAAWMAQRLSGRGTVVTDI